VETRRNGITYRSNLARLADQLIKEGKYDKAEDIFDLAMEKMPVEKFEFYSLLEPFVLGYYEIEKSEKARKVFQSVAKQYQEHLLYYSGLELRYQNSIFDEIYSDLGRYRALIEILVEFDTEEYAKKEASKFNGFLRMFNSDPAEDSLIDTDLNPTESDTLLNTETDSVN
jgi:tetratricopeptide (TPR) repeat protein